MPSSFPTAAFAAARPSESCIKFHLLLHSVGGEVNWRMGLNAAVGHHSEVDGITFHGAFVVVLVFVSFVVARNARHALRHETDSVACDLTVPYGQTVPLTSSEKSGGSG